jgi:hypothetical protein
LSDFSVGICPIEEKQEVRSGKEGMNASEKIEVRKV